MRNWTCCNTCGSGARGVAAESRKMPLLRGGGQIPYLGTDRSGAGGGHDAYAAIGSVGKRQLWVNSGLALETRLSADIAWWRSSAGSKKLTSIRGLNKDPQTMSKGLFKTERPPLASVSPGPFQDFLPSALATASSRPWHG